MSNKLQFCCLHPFIQSQLFAGDSAQTVSSLCVEAFDVKFEFHKQLKGLLTVRPTENPYPNISPDKNTESELLGCSERERIQMNESEQEMPTGCRVNAKSVYTFSHPTIASRQCFRAALHLSYCTTLWQWTTGFLYFLQSNLMSIFCAQGWRLSPLWGPDRCLTEWWMSLHPSIIGFSLFGLSLAACLPGSHLHLSIKFAPLPTGWPSDSYANAAGGFWLAAAWLA